MTLRLSALNKQLPTEQAPQCDKKDRITVNLVSPWNIAVFGSNYHRHRLSDLNQRTIKLPDWTLSNKTTQTFHPIYTSALNADAGVSISCRLADSALNATSNLYP